MDHSADASDAPPASATPNTSITDLQQLDAYPWSLDATFQAGLSSILETQGNDFETPQREGLVAKARCFYFLRKHNINIDPAVYMTWRTSQPAFQLSPLLPATATPPTASISPTPSKQASTTHGTSSDSALEPATPAQPPAVYTPTFDEIVALIQSNQPIPGIRDIPDTVLTGQGSTTTTPARRKPWERSQRSEEPAAMLPTVAEVGAMGSHSAGQGDE